MHLKGLTNLSSLELRHTQVTDAGLAHLKGLTNLGVSPRSTRVTDAGLAHLKGLTNLSGVDLGRLNSPTTEWKSYNRPCRA